MRYDLPLTDAVATLYRPFCKPRSGGVPEVLFVNSVRHGREAAELMQLADIKPHNITFDKEWDFNKWGFGDFYGVRGDMGDQRIMLENLEETLLSEQRYDCIVLPAINGWNGLGEAARRALFDRVNAGAGLVLVQPMQGAGDASGVQLSDISPLLPASHREPYGEEWFGDMRGGAWEPCEHYITRGIPFSLFPYERLCHTPCRAEGQIIIAAENGDPVAAVRKLGKGRVAAFSYYHRDFMPQHADYRGLDGCFNPVMDTWRGAKLPFGYDFTEAFYRLVARAIYWCAGMDGDGIVSALFDGDALHIKYGNGKLYASLYNRYGDQIAGRQHCGSVLPLPQAAVTSGGDIRAELSLENEGGVADFYTAMIHLPERASLRVDLSDAVRLNGDTLTASVALAGEADELQVGLLDDYGRLLAMRRVSPAPETAVAFALADILSAHVRVEAAALSGGLITARARSSDCTVTPPDRKLHDFEVFMNPQNRGQGDLLPHINALFPQIGMTGTFIGDNRVTAMSGAHGLGVYWYNRHPYIENKERWLETGDKQYLRRNPCLNDEAFWEANRAAIHENVGRQKQYGPIAYFAQDEGSLTCYSDEMDFCFCEHCMEGLQGWLREQYETLGALNKAWRTGYTSWSQAVPLTRAEAREAGVWSSWADHRRFMELTYTDAYRRMRDYIKERDPEGEVRMSGCQASTAYTGNDYELLHRHVRYFEAYPVGGQYEFHRSFKRPGTILGGWFGYGASGKGARNSIWNALFHGLTLCSIFWEYAMLNPDFSFSQSALDLGEVFAEIRRKGIGKLLLYAAEQDTMGVAMHYSMDSVHATNIAGKKKLFEQNREAWCRLLEDVGAQYRFVSSDQIREGMPGGTRLLILPYSLALGDEEAAAIKAFVQNGGIVLGDIQTGLYDGHCVRREVGALDEVFGIRRLSFDMDAHSQDGEFVKNPDFSHFSLDGLDTEEGPGIQKAEPGIRAAAGVRAFSDTFSGHVAAVIVGSYGEGHGIYLNLAAHSYLEQSERGDGEGLRLLLRRILQFAGVGELTRIESPQSGEPLAGVECFYYTALETKIYAVKRGVGRQKINYDGLGKNTAGDGADTLDCRVTLPETGHVYNLRKGTYEGQGREVSAALTEGDAALWAVLPARVTGISLAHDGCDFRASLQTDGGAIGQTVFAVEVRREDGSHCALYSRNIIAEGGAAAFTIPLALNEQGPLSVTVRDTLTGISSDTVILPPPIAVGVWDDAAATP